MAINPEEKLPGDVNTSNEEFLDALLRHQVGLLRVSGSVRNEVIRLLDATEEDLRRQISRGMRAGAGLASPREIRRLDALLRDINEIREAVWRDVGTLWLDRMTQIILAEPGTLDNILKTVIPVSLETRLPAARTLKAIVSTQPFEGKTLKQWSRNIAAADISRIDDQIKIGLTQGETTPQITRRVVGRVRTNGTDGVTEITRRQATAITRTAINAYANQARREYTVENDDIFEQEQYVATLDSRTTVICASLDGQLFPIGEGPIPPLHFNCRSIRVPVIADAPLARRPTKPFTTRTLLREFTEQNNLATVTRRSDLPRGFKGQFDTFSRGRVRELIGGVPDTVSYQVWLGRQSVEFQDDYLGVTKARLFRAGTPLTSFVDPAGRPITLNELARVDADAFRAAGLNPSDFVE